MRDKAVKKKGKSSLSPGGEGGGEGGRGLISKFRSKVRVDKKKGEEEEEEGGGVTTNKEKGGGEGGGSLEWSR